MIRNSNHTARLIRIVLVLFSFSLFAGLLGCGYTPPSSTVISIQGPASDSIDPGDSASLTATVTDTSNFGLPDLISDVDTERHRMHGSSVWSAFEFHDQHCDVYGSGECRDGVQR